MEDLGELLRAPKLVTCMQVITNGYPGVILCVGQVTGCVIAYRLKASRVNGDDSVGRVAFSAPVTCMDSGHSWLFVGLQNGYVGQISLKVI